MEPFLGQIQPFGFNFPPRGWALCNGQLLAISSNTALFSLLGTTFGGDGRTTFGLPELRGRTMVHVGNGPGLPEVRWGQRFGNQDNVLPAHSHNGVFGLGVTEDDATLDEPSPNVSIGTGATIFSTGAQNTTLRGSNFTTSSTGSGSGANQNYQPSMGIYISIATVGIYPSRN